MSINHLLSDIKYSLILMYNRMYPEGRSVVEGTKADHLVSVLLSIFWRSALLWFQVELLSLEGLQCY
jgi:hypothetical protein